MLNVILFATAVAAHTLEPVGFGVSIPSIPPYPTNGTVETKYSTAYSTASPTSASSGLLLSTKSAVKPSGSAPVHSYSSSVGTKSSLASTGVPTKSYIVSYGTASKSYGTQPTIIKTSSGLISSQGTSDINSGTSVLPTLSYSPSSGVSSDLSHSTVSVSPSKPLQHTDSSSTTESKISSSSEQALASSTVVASESSTVTASEGIHSTNSSPIVGSSITASASTLELVTSVYLSYYITTCSVSTTSTSNGVLVPLQTVTKSTVTETITSTICTKCVPPSTATSAPGTPATIAQTSPEKVHGTSSVESGPSSSSGVEAQGSSTPGSIASGSNSQGSHSAINTGSNQPSSNNQEIKGSSSAPTGSAAENTSKPLKTLSVVETLVPVPKEASQTSPKPPKTTNVVIETLVPLPVYAYQTDTLLKSAATSAPFSTKQNGTASAATATGTPVASGSVSPSVSAETFRGAASRVDGELFGIFAGLVGTLMMLL